MRAKGRRAVPTPTLGSSLARFGTDCAGACCGSAGGAAEDPLGASFLPLGDTGAAARLRLVREIVMAPAFEGFIQLCILGSSAALAFDMPSVVPGSERASRFYEKYFKPLPFERKDGEQPYVAWLGDALLKVATDRRIRHPCDEGTSSNASDSDSQASTC